MIDIYLNGAEIHAGAPEEELGAALFLNGVLSGKTADAGGCLCPDQKGSTVSKGFILRMSEGTDLSVSPVLDVDGTPELEICCCVDTAGQEVSQGLAYQIALGSKPALRDYILAMYQFCERLTNSELAQIGHDWKMGRIRLVQALETVDALADYSEEAATEEFGNFMEVNFPNVIFKPAFVNPRAARWQGM